MAINNSTLCWRPIGSKFHFPTDGKIAFFSIGIQLQILILISIKTVTKKSGKVKILLKILERF